MNNVMTDALNPTIEYQRTMSLGESLANSGWRRYCEGLTGTKRATTAILLENLRQFISNMDETTRVMQIGNFDKFAFPIVRAVYPNLVASELVSVQP